MRPRRCCAISLLLFLLSCVAAGAESAQPEASPLSPSEYVAELDRLLSAVKDLDRHPERSADLLEQLPAVWHVDAERQKFAISPDWLRRDIHVWKASRDRSDLNRVIEGLQVRRSEAVSFQEPPLDASGARAALPRILAGREFSDVHAPTWIDRMKERVARFMFELLGRAFQSSWIPTISRLFVGGLIALAVVMLAFWMYRALRSNVAHETLRVASLPVSAKEWTTWLAEARSAADGGNWREAIHFAYWCSITFLEARGMWRPDRARTPREYLRLLPASSEHHPALTALTRCFERVWYGTDAADAEIFSQALAQLKKLGCPST